MLIATAIAVLILGLGFTILNGATLARRASQSRIQASDSARIFFRMLERDLAGAYPGPWSTPFKKKDLVYSTADVSGQVIEMTTTTEDRSPGAELISVRYYVLSANQRLYREVSLMQSGGDPFANDPTAAAASNDYVLLPQAEELSADYLRYDETAKTWIAATGPDYLDATHLDVKLKFFDPNEKLSIADRTRIFRKLVPIPAAMKD